VSNFHKLQNKDFRKKPILFWILSAGGGGNFNDSGKATQEIRTAAEKY
jgi:hypothetical protein